MNKILFTVRSNGFNKDVSCDYFLPVQISDKDFELCTMMSALEELSVIPDHIKKTFDEISGFFRIATLRLKFNNDMFPEILLISLPGDTEMDRESLDLYLQSMSQDKLNKFLEEASIKTRSTFK